MGIYCSYDVVKVENVRPVARNGYEGYFVADVTCENEHEHLMATVKDVLCNHGGFVQYAENVVDEDTPDFDADFAFFEPLCANYPGYDVHNEHEFVRMLEEAAGKREEESRIDIDEAYMLLSDEGLVVNHDRHTDSGWEFYKVDPKTLGLIVLAVERGLLKTVDGVVSVVQK